VLPLLTSKKLRRDRTVIHYLNVLEIMSNPWEQMAPMLKMHGYTQEQINEMTMAELFEILAQDE
jgi:hypothetical protein